MLQTPLCHQIGIAYPIFSVGMGPVAGPELAAAVSNAGGCGVLGGVLKPAPYLQQEIHRLHTLTDKPFGVNLILPLLQEGQIEKGRSTPAWQKGCLFWCSSGEIPGPTSQRRTSVIPRSSSKWAQSRRPRQPPTLVLMRSSSKASKRGGM